MSWIKTPTTKNVCPGIRDFLRPTVRYVKCHVCGGDVEIWSDESDGECINCGKRWTKPNENASCLNYCEYAEQCKHIIASQQNKS